MYRVYVLLNVDKRRYIGLSEDVHRRLLDHNSGVSKWTAKHVPWQLEWVSRELNLGDARRLENKLKRQKGGDGLQRLMEEFGSSSGS